MTLSSKLDSVCAVSVQECQLLKLNFKAVSSILAVVVFMVSPYGIGQTIIFSSCRLLLFFFLFFPRLISAVVEWMSAILAHGVALVRI